MGDKWTMMSCWLYLVSVRVMVRFLWMQPAHKFQTVAPPLLGVCMPSCIDCRCAKYSPQCFWLIPTNRFATMKQRNSILRFKSYHLRSARMGAKTGTGPVITFWFCLRTNQTNILFDLTIKCCVFQCLRASDSTNNQLREAVYPSLHLFAPSCNNWLILLLSHVHNAVWTQCDGKPKEILNRFCSFYSKATKQSPATSKRKLKGSILFVVCSSCLCYIPISVNLSLWSQADKKIKKNKFWTSVCR